MLKYFYNLYFEYPTYEDFMSTFDLGYYTTQGKAKQKIDFYKEKPGFKDFDTSCFHIKKIGVHFGECVDKDKAVLHIVTCEKEIDGGYEWTDFGAFATYCEAEEEMKKQKSSHTNSK